MDKEDYEQYNNYSERDRQSITIAKLDGDIDQNTTTATNTGTIATNTNVIVANTADLSAQLTTLHNDMTTLNSTLTTNFSTLHTDLVNILAELEKQTPAPTA